MSESRPPSIPPPSAPGVYFGGHRLDEIAREVPGATVVGDPATRVFGVHHDSRTVEPGDLFVARRGDHHDGTRFVSDAVARGAYALLALRGTVDPATCPLLPIIEVDDIAAGLAYAAACVYGHPSFSLDVVGITGTNGKTTTAHLVRAMIDGVFARPVCGVIGTVGHSYGTTHVEAEHTTPEADEVSRVMALFRSEGATHIAMEASSIALALGRVRAVRFRVAAFTNLTQDHLDYHGSMEAYAEAKASLFTTYGPGGAVVNVDDAFGRDVARRVRAPLVRVSARVDALLEEADVAPVAASFSAQGIVARFRTPAGEVDIDSRLIGAHNLENISVALGIACALELDMVRAAATLGQTSGAPGRLERCDTESDDIVVLVDYAHTPDAVDKVLASVRGVTSGKLVCVLGCGGDRDTTKRRPMGEAAGRWADAVVVTNDNPRTEAPESIADAVAVGVLHSGKVALAAGARLTAGTYCCELDRRKAIELAVFDAEPGDVVVIAGKGHEAYQVVGHVSRPFDDRVEARRALKARALRAASAPATPREPDKAP